MTRKNILTSLFLTLLLTTTMSGTVFAAEVQDQILPPLQDIIGADNAQKVNIPQKNFRNTVIPNAISIMLGLAGVIAFLVFVITGIMLVVSQGEEEIQTKVKKIFAYAIFGLALIALSYAIIYGVFTLEFQ